MWRIPCYPWILRWYNIPHLDYICGCVFRALWLISREQFQTKDLFVIKVQRNAIVFMDLDLMNSYKFTEKIYFLPHSLREVMHPLCTSHLPFMHLTDFVWAYFIVQDGHKKIEGVSTIKCSALIKTLSMLVQKRDTVESLFFMGDLCLRLWVTLAQKFTSSQLYIQAFK